MSQAALMEFVNRGVEAQRAVDRELDKFERMKKACERRPHATRARYVAGCRCMLCRAANSRYEVERSRQRESGDWNGIVDAGPARLHLATLSKHGIGRRNVGEITGISGSVLHKIKTGRRRQIRARTARLILAVDRHAASQGTLVSAGPSWQLLNELIDGGYTRRWLAAQLGSKAKVPSLQVRRAGKIKARTAVKIERLYKLIQAGKVSR